MNGRDGVDGDCEDAFVVVDPFHVRQLYIGVQYGVVWRGAVQGNGKVKLSYHQTPISQHGQPRVS